MVGNFKNEWRQNLALNLVEVVKHLAEDQTILHVILKYDYL
jgi:hypothetical protein